MFKLHIFNAFCFRIATFAQQAPPGTCDSPDAPVYAPHVPVRSRVQCLRQPWQLPALTTRPPVCLDHTACWLWQLFGNKNDMGSPQNVKNTSACWLWQLFENENDVGSLQNAKTTPDCWLWQLHGNLDYIILVYDCDNSLETKVT